MLRPVLQPVLQPVLRGISGALGGAVRLVSPESLAPRVAFSRVTNAQTLLGSGAYQAAPIDVPRFVGAAVRLLVEALRGNSVTNPRAEGAAPGTLPTGYSVTGNTAEVTMTCNGAVSALGMTGVQVLVSGTATAGGTIRLNLPNASFDIPAGGVAAFSVFHQLVQGTGLTGTSLRAAGAASSAMTIPSPSAGVKRDAAIFSFSAAATAAAMGYNVGYAAGTVNIVINLFWPQFEANAAAPSSPILPPVGTVAASTRAVDVPQVALTAAEGLSGSLVGTFMLPQAASAGSPPIAQGLFVLHDGTDANRIALRNAAGSSTINAIKVVGGTVTNIGTLGTMTPGVPFRAALAWDPAGTTVCMAGGTPVRMDGALPPVSWLLLGHNQVELSAAAFGEIGPLDLYPTRLADAALQSLTA